MSIKLPRLYCLFALFLFCSLSIHGQYAFRENNLPDYISLHPFAEFTNLDNKSISIETVIANQAELGFKPVAIQNRDLGFSSSNFWVRFALQNKTNKPLEYYLETGRPITNLVELYKIENSTITKSESGDGLPFSKRSYSHRKTIFKIEIPKNSTQLFYIHLKSDGEVLNLPLMLRTSENLMKVTAFEQFIFGIFYGILLTAAVIYLFFFFGLKDRTFIYYSLYVIFIGLLQFSIDGYFYQYITPQAGWFSQNAVLIFAIIAAIFLGRYSQIFLKIKLYDKALNRFFDVVYCLLVLLLLVLIFVPTAKPYAYPLANLLGLIILILIITSIIFLYYKKKPVDPFFTAGIFFLAAGFLVFILNNFGQIPTTFFSQNSSKFGTGLEVIFLSLSMANLIRRLRNEREEFNSIALNRLEEMNEMKSYFLSNISHELRTPLNAIMSLSSEMSITATEEKVRQNSEIIKYSSQSLLSSVNDILDFSKIEKGELRIENSDFDVKAVFNAIKNNAERRANDQGLSFKYTISPEIPTMLIGDEARLAQIVNNLLSNAIKFTAEGHIDFKIDSENIKDNIARITITVADSGVGIAQEKMNNIFGSFTQDNINNKRKYGGLGLGLYIVKALVDMQNGTISMESQVGKGTTCKISIEYEISKVTPVVLETQIFDLEGKSILVVEDNAINQMVIKAITKKWQNTTVKYTNNGQEGIDALRLGKFDIILMDLQMPVMDGYEATIAIRNGEAGVENTNIPIIAVTADVMESTKQTVVEIGMNHYLSKPIKNEILYQAIKKLL